MNWPIYNYPPHMDNLPGPIVRHNRMNPHIDTRAIHVGAVDVFRDGVHLYRNYTDGQDVDAWALEEFGPDAPNTHDSGLWGIPSVTGIAEHPIPTAASMQPIGSLDDVINLVCALFAIGQVPNVPDISAAPNKPMLTGRLARTSRGYILWKGESDGVAVRLMLGRAENVAKALGVQVAYTIKLERREVRTGVTDPGTIKEQFMTFQAAENCPPHILVTEAKSVLGLTGWPMTRRPKENLWMLSNAPFQLKIERLDG